MQIVPIVFSAVFPAVFSAVVAAVIGAAPAEAATPAVQVGTTADLVRYDADLIPDGARARAVTVSAGSPAGTLTTLTVRGLLPHHEYGAHVHTKPCGAAPTDSGPHYQHVPDAVQPSTDPAYANPRNEIWLDITTGADGAALAVSQVNWTYGERLPASVVVHETHTHTEPGHAGTAGDRLACLDLRFDR